MLPLPPFLWEEAAALLEAAGSEATAEKEAAIEAEGLNNSGGGCTTILRETASRRTSCTNTYWSMV